MQINNESHQLAKFFVRRKITNYCKRKMSNWIEHSLKLEGEKVLLLPLEEKHFEELLKFSREEMIWSMWMGRSMPEEKLLEALKEALVLKQKGEQYPFVIIDKTKNRIIGSTRYLKLDEAHRNLEIGWTFYLPEYWGKGFNDECKLLLLTHCFEELKTVRVEFRISEKNSRSRKAVERIGGKFEGLHRNMVIRPTGKINVAFYSIIDEEWDETKMKLTELVKSKNKMQSDGETK